MNNKISNGRVNITHYYSQIVTPSYTQFAVLTKQSSINFQKRPQVFYDDDIGVVHSDWCCHTTISMATHVPFYIPLQAACFSCSFCTVED